MEKADKIWMDGTIVDWNDAHVHLVSNTLQYGFGVFEGIRCYKTESGPAVFRLKEHLVRLHHSAAKILGFEIPYSVEQLTEATRQTIRENKFEQCYIRPIAYIGYGGMGLAYDECKINVSIAVWQWGEYVGHGTLEKGKPRQGFKLRSRAHQHKHVEGQGLRQLQCYSRWRGRRPSATAMTRRSFSMSTVTWPKDP